MLESYMVKISIPYTVVSSAPCGILGKEFHQLFTLTFFAHSLCIILLIIHVCVRFHSHVHRAVEAIKSDVIFIISVGQLCRLRYCYRISVRPSVCHTLVFC